MRIFSNMYVFDPKEIFGGIPCGWQIRKRSHVYYTPKWISRSMLQLSDGSNFTAVGNTVVRKYTSIWWKQKRPNLVGNWRTVLRNLSRNCFQIVYEQICGVNAEIKNHHNKVFHTTIFTTDFILKISIKHWKSCRLCKRSEMLAVWRHITGEGTRGWLLRTIMSALTRSQELLKRTSTASTFPHWVCVGLGTWLWIVLQSSRVLSRIREICVVIELTAQTPNLIFHK